jgi:hypothetical protein
MKDKLFWPILIGGGAVIGVMYYMSRPGGTLAPAQAAQPGTPANAPTSGGILSGLLGSFVPLDQTPQAYANANAPFSGLLTALGLGQGYIAPAASDPLAIDPEQFEPNYQYALPSLDFGS